MTRSFARATGLLLFSWIAFGAISIDVNTSTDRAATSTTVVTPAFSTSAGNELLLAFIASDYKTGANTTVRSIAGGGLTWTLVVRTNRQSGTSEIWRAFATTPLSNITVTATLSQSVVSSITVMSFSGVNASGTNGSGAIGATGSGSATSGGPTASLVTTSAGSLVVGVGNDFDNAIARTPGAGQSIVHQYLTSLGDTYWVQMTNAAVAASGTTVTVNDTAPVSDRYNLSIAEILAASSGTPTWNISGTITGGAGSSVSLGGTATAVTTADPSGNYTFSGLSNGPYTVTPTRSGLTFVPASQPVTVNGASVTGVNFAAQALTWSISGTISGAGGGGSSVSLAGTATAVTTADASGNYTFSGLSNGSYTVTPAKSGLSFVPASRPVTVSGASVTGVNFAAQALTWSISGTISGAGGGGSSVSLAGTATAVTTADASGNYTFSGLNNGSYTVTPTKSGLTFVPASQPVTVSGASVTGVNFAAQALTWSISGTISGAGGAGATVNLSGTANASTIADAAGSYRFSGLAAGSYTVTPTQSLYTFTPASASVNINGADQTAVNFASQANGSTWNISGSITPGSSGAGTLVTATGAANVSATADANGNYTLSQLPNGSYTITPSKSGYTFTPASQLVTINGTNVSGVAFTAVQAASSITLDVNVSKDGSGGSTTISSPAFSTSSGNELLLALVATDFLGGTNTTVTSVSGGGLAWSLVVRSNGQGGTSEIWRAFTPVALSNVTATATLSQSVSSSITVMSFTGVNTSGTNGSAAIGATGKQSAASGAPAASLVTVGSGSWVLGVGNDYDRAVARTPGPGQAIVHQFLAPVGDTYWVQRLLTPVPASGTSVTINDTAPTADRFNLSIVEIVSATGGTADSTPPTVSMISPVQGAGVANMVTVSAAASDNTAVAGVQFLLDGAPLGTEVTSPPYSLIWDSTKATSGAHALGARARDVSGLTAVSTSVGVTVDNSGNPAIVGSWSLPVNLPAVAVNLMLLPNDRVMFYQDGPTATIWNYVQNSFTSVPTSIDLFCSGHALLADGRILVVGGFGGSGSSFGIANAEIFDPNARTWTPVPNMAYKRWYPTATTLPDGRVLVMAGWQTSAHSNAGISEIYDPVRNTWTQLTNANNPFETYPFIYVLPDGRVIHIGGSEYATDTDILDLTTNTWSVLDPNIVDGGSATMYSPGKFMKAGSAADSQMVGPSSNTTFVLDTTQPSPAWRQTSSMVYSRSFLNLTTLPDGSVLATGGETDKDGGNVSNAVYAAELWSAQTQTWSTMASMRTPREYHGTALLLPDGRVLVSGMGADFGNVPDQKTAEFFSPPYLFKGARPRIDQAPAQIHYGANFVVTTPDAASISSVTLIRSGAVTHFFDQNERSVPLSFSQTAGGLSVTAPASANLAPPGYFMLFLVNSSGVPSIAPFVQVVQ